MTAVTYVDGFRFALGTQKRSVEESAAAGRTRSDAADLLAAGFRYHHVCDDTETALDLARAAVATTDRAGLDAIVYATCIPENGNVGDRALFDQTGDVKYLMDFPASRLQAELGLDRAIVIGLNQQACTGMLGAIRLARALLAAETDMDRILCLTSDRFPPGACYEQAYSLISDGAAACVVSRSPASSASYRLVAAHHITNGAMVGADDDETVGAYFSFTYRLVIELLAKAGKTSSDLNWVVPQNTNTKAWQILARLLGIDHDRIFHPSLADVGHMISGDNMVNMTYLGTQGSRVVQTGDLVLLVMAGYGMNWQGLLLEKT